ncbi:helicase domain protein [Francisella cf. novicida Fx1]|uniref:helicase-related protein n=1 Tax=Francisella tularensis TaxID=263 RepID=UPI00020590DA|nr:helicase-related protein [Francisella tularensis]AEB27219.1 helicase domain protein [Francisella cf. novicida Fx1]
MPSKFFTNQSDNTLENRLTDILKNYDIKNLEFLLGYFRISGFKKISKYLQGVDRARILVGINIDKLTLDAQNRGKELNKHNSELFQNEFLSQQSDVLKKSQYAQEVDESVSLLVEMLASKQLEIRISREKNIHAKVYILREKDIKRHNGTTEYRGSIITGSSNLSENGLTKNYEFNVELKDSDDIEFGLYEFEKLWQDAIEISEQDVENIKSNTYLKEITPYELYLKFLIEHFGERIDYDPSVANDLPKGFMKLAYQIDAVNDGFLKIQKHNGFFLSDVVGLGKTITTTMIIRKLLSYTKGKILIIAPPSIKQEWEETFSKFAIGTARGYQFVSNGSLNKIKNIEDYETIIIDESHKFKNWATSRYKELEKITKENSKYNKKIILISATPLNNAPMDLANQLYLFQDSRNSTIDSFPNLAEFFSNINDRFKKIIGRKPIDSLDPNQASAELTVEERQELEELSKEIGTKILREVMVRRTRTDILTFPRYKEDIDRQGLKIPDINPVELVEYKLDDRLLELFNQTVDILTTQVKYSRYMILAKLGDHARAEFKLTSNNMPDNIFEVGAKNLADIIRTSSIKALESSFVAFKSMMNNQKKSLEKLIQMFNKDDIFVSTDVNVYELADKYDEDEFTDKLDEMVFEGKAKKLSKDDFADGYLDELKADLYFIDKLCKDWGNVNKDPKLDRLKQIIQSNKKDKIVVFTESKKTANYLGQQLADTEQVLTITSENRDRLKDTIRENFDANYHKQKNDYSVIISTDTLSEGVNMHRSNIIYNYDIPWNSTRLMQRIGRINRIGTKHDEIFVYNFKPTAESEKYIELSKKAFTKLQAFHDALGEDSQIYTQDERVGTKNLYSQDSFLDIDKELEFLEEIREFAEQNPKQYREIKKLDNKVRVQRRVDKYKDISFVFIKNDTHKNYYKVADINDLGIRVKAIDFVEMAKNLKAQPDEKPILPIIKKHYQDVTDAYQQYENEINSIIQKQNSVVKDLGTKKNSKDKKALQYLNKLQLSKQISKELFQQYKELITNGRYQNLAKEVLAIEKDSKDMSIEFALQKVLEDKNITTDKTVTNKINKNLEIILSETFV